MKITAILAFCVLLTACPPVKPENSTTDNLVSEKILTIVFLDVSGSFNKFQKQGGFKGKNYFDESCNELISRIEKKEMKIGQECLIVKFIKDKSFSDETLVCKIDLTDDRYVFQVSRPDNDLNLPDWEDSLKLFNERVKIIIEKDINKAISVIKTFRDNHINRPAMYTDIVNAFTGIKPVIESDKYANYKKYLIVYSDFKEDTETKRNLSNINIDLQDVEIEGRFVSKNDFSTLEDYNNNLEEWKKILKCKKLTFKTPEECINNLVN